jgi:CO/xanthine dehydrogenase Mo-binding subunit
MAAERRIKHPLRENSYFTFEQRQFPEDPEYRIIGRNVPARDVDRIDGSGLFMRDISLPGMLYAKWHTSPYAHARVKRIDADGARSMKGVIDVLTCDDPDVRDLFVLSFFDTQSANIKRPDLAFVLPCEAVYEGQPVGVAVAAETEALADEALRHVKVEWEELPFVVDQDEALRPDAPVAQLFRGQSGNAVDPAAAGLAPFAPWTPPGSTKCERGDLERGFREADRVIEFELRAGTNGWGGGGVEPLAALAYIHDGYLDLWTRANVNSPVLPGPVPMIPEGTVVPLAAKLAGIPLNRVRVHVPYSGSSFGGINWNANHALPVALAVIFARRTGRPVMALADWTSFSGISNEESGHYWFKVGFREDGTVTAVWVRSNASWGTSALTIPGCDKLYKSTAIENCRCESVFPYVNKAPVACYKHGSTEAIVFNEVFSRVAAALGKSPMEVALKNDGSFGRPMHEMDEMKRKQGFPTRDSLREVVTAVREASGWDEIWHPPGTKRLPNGKYHGVGFAWLEQWRPAPVNSVAVGLSAGLHFMSDGTAVIKGLRNPVGNHEEDTYCQIVAEEAGLRYEDVVMDHEYNEASLEKPGGSAGLAMNSIIMKELGMNAKRRILEVAALHMGKKPEELEVLDSVVFERANPGNRISVADLVKLYPIKFAGGVWATGEKTVRASELPPTPMEVRYWGRQAAVLEVEVDPDTGKIDIKRLVIANDVGRVINPASVAGQQYGGAYMGIGRAMTEEIVYDPNTGVKLNDNLTWYHVLTMADVFRIDAIAVETGLGYGAYGNMGVGEDPNALTRSLLRSAVYNALGVWVDEDPITPDRVLKALGKANLRAEASR